MDREKVINYLENEIFRAEQSVNNIWLEYVEVKLLRDALALIKEQEHKDKMFHALEEDWKRLKELLKDQQQQIWEFQDQVEYLTDKLKEQEPVKPEWRKGTPFCGNCGHRLEKKSRNMDGCKCPNCEKAVKWE